MKNFKFTYGSCNIFFIPIGIHVEFKHFYEEIFIFYLIVLYIAWFPFQDFSNPDSKQIQQIYNSYEKYQLELNIMSKQVQSAFELNENLIKDIKNSNDWINNYLNNRFTYQQDDVYKELLQINRDYQICGRGVEQYD
ncbi:hypothetical protein pb186bvf_014662 [Paramecium bursaria]